MGKYQCFKSKRGTKYDRALKKHFSMLPKWEIVFDKVGEILDEKITRMAFETDELYLDISGIKKEENKKLFTKDGRLKKNSNRAKSVLGLYKDTIQDEGLSEFQDLRLINFTHGIMRLRGQKLESFKTSKDDIYFKADFDLESKSNGSVEPISEIEYEEKYLEELKNREK
jgi:hypothetical protein